VGRPRKRFRPNHPHSLHRGGKSCFSAERIVFVPREGPAEAWVQISRGKNRGLGRRVASIQNLPRSDFYERGVLITWESTRPTPKIRFINVFRARPYEGKFSLLVKKEKGSFWRCEQWRQVRSLEGKKITRLNSTSNGRGSTACRASQVRVSVGSRRPL